MGNGPEPVQFNRLRLHNTPLNDRSLGTSSRGSPGPLADAGQLVAEVNVEVVIDHVVDFTHHHLTHRVAHLPKNRLFLKKIFFYVKNAALMYF